MTLRDITIDNSVKYINKAVRSRNEIIPLSPSMPNTKTKRSQTLKKASHNKKKNSQNIKKFIKKTTGEGFTISKWWIKIYYF